jgi:hypothetical protein
VRFVALQFTLLFAVIGHLTEPLAPLLLVSKCRCGMDLTCNLRHNKSRA